jgi:UDP-N-acetyl-D-glucosamine dehydrogenase
MMVDRPASVHPAARRAFWAALYNQFQAVEADGLRNLKEKLDARTATVGVVGLGYAGLPLAIAFAEAGFPVVGVDVDAAKVKRLNEGQSYIDDVSSDQLGALVCSGRFRASATYDALADADAITICVPTPLAEARRPDLRFVERAAEELGRVLRDGQLIVLESTTVPGTTEEVLLPALAAGDRQVGRDFFLGYAPERIDPGNKRFGVKNTPKIVSGITPSCRDLVGALYGAIVDQIVPVSSPRAAETTKLVENTFRAVNVAFANELAMLCNELGVDVWEVIDAAATKPFGFMPFYPGPGCGGHCIPVVPFFLSWKMKTLGTVARFIELSGEVNDAMPAFVVTRVMEALNEDGRALNGARVVVLGVAYKPNVADTRESPSLEVLRLLRERGADAVYNDPHVDEVALTGFGWHGGWITRQPVLAAGPVRTKGKRAPVEVLHGQTLDERLLREADCVVIATHHRDYDWAWVARHARVIVDTRNVTRDLDSASTRARIVRL